MESLENKECFDPDCKTPHRTECNYLGLDVFCIYGENFVVGSKQAFILAYQEYRSDCEDLWTFTPKFIYEYLVDSNKIKDNNRSKMIEVLSKLLDLSEDAQDILKIIIADNNDFTKYIHTRFGITAIVESINHINGDFQLITDLVTDEKILQRYCWNDKIYCFPYED